jgi:hypothetical protein
VQWPLRTLVAWLFAERQCDEVRAILARGEGMRDGARATWNPVALSPAELTAIEKTFPLPEPDRKLEVATARASLLTSGQVQRLAPNDPRVVAAAPRAVYRWFDYGSWADVWESTVADGVIRLEMTRPGVDPPWGGEG